MKELVLRGSKFFPFRVAPNEKKIKNFHVRVTSLGGICIPHKVFNIISHNTIKFCYLDPFWVCLKVVISWKVLILNTVCLC